MFGELGKYVAVFLTGLLVAYVLTPLVRSLASRFGVVISLATLETGRSPNVPSTFLGVLFRKISDDFPSGGGRIAC